MPLGSLLFIAMLVCVPPALYVDAIAHGIGRIPGDKESLSAGSWAILSALPGFGIAFALGYLISRSRPHRKSRHAPRPRPEDAAATRYLRLPVPVERPRHRPVRAAATA